MASADAASVTPPRAPLWSFRNEKFGGAVRGVVGLSLYRSMVTGLWRYASKLCVRSEVETTWVYNLEDSENPMV